MFFYFLIFLVSEKNRPSFSAYFSLLLLYSTCGKLINTLFKPTWQSLFPCGICNKNISINHKSFKCSNCNYKIHIKCNKIDDSIYDKIKTNSELILCLKCQEDIIPFQNISDEQFYMTSEKGFNIDQLNLSVLPNNSLKTYFNDISNVNSNDTDADTQLKLNVTMLK